jgi:hypothetical protein
MILSFYNARNKLEIADDVNISKEVLINIKYLANMLLESFLPQNEPSNKQQVSSNILQSFKKGASRRELTYPPQRKCVSI